MSAVLHHIADLGRLFISMRRVLATDGRLILIDGVILEADQERRLRSELAKAGLPGEAHYGFDRDRLANLLRTYTTKRFTLVARPA